MSNSSTVNANIANDWACFVRASASTVNRI
jgi:hypothetical protein